MRGFRHLEIQGGKASGDFHLKHQIWIWMFPKLGVPPNHLTLIGFSIIFTIHFGVPLFLETTICILS